MPVAAPPTAPPGPVAPPAAPAAPEPSLEPDLYGAGAEIDALDGKEPTPPPPKTPAAPKKEDEEPEPKEAPREAHKNEIDREIEELDIVENPEATTRPKAPEQPEPEEKPPVRMRDLKTVYEQVKSEKKTLEGRVTELTAELDRARKSNPDEVKTLTERLEKSEKARTELESELRFLNYSKHPEYQEKFQKPYVQAWEAALTDLQELTVADADGNERPANKEDMLELANMPYGLAAKKALDLFGPVAAAQIMAHRKNIIDLSRAQQRALEEARKASDERDKTRAIEERKMNEQLSTMWKAENEALANRFPRWFKPVEGDAEGNALLEKGFGDVDKFFNDREMPNPERVKLHAKIRAKAANHDRLALRLKRATLRIKKLQDDLAAYEGAEPPGGKGRQGSKKGSGTGNVWGDADKEIEALDDKSIS